MADTDTIGVSPISIEGFLAHYPPRDHHQTKTDRLLLELTQDALGRAMDWLGASIDERLLLRVVPTLPEGGVVLVLTLQYAAVGRGAHVSFSLPTVTNKQLRARIHVNANTLPDILNLPEMAVQQVETELTTFADATSSGPARRAVVFRLPREDVRRAPRTMHRGDVRLQPLVVAAPKEPCVTAAPPANVELRIVIAGETLTAMIPLREALGLVAKYGAQ